MWSGRYLTPVHTGQYWKNTYDEIARIYKAPEVQPLDAWPTLVVPSPIPEKNG